MVIVSSLDTNGRVPNLSLTDVSLYVFKPLTIFTRCRINATTNILTEKMGFE